MATEENMWEDNEFDNEFEDDNDDEFNKSGGGWEESNDDPFELDPNDPNGGWPSDEDVDVFPEDDTNAEIENAFWSAYYEKDDKQAALTSFLRVIELINNGGEDTDDFKFKSLTEIVILYFEQNAMDETVRYFKQFLISSKTVKPNDLSSNLRKILNATKVNESIYGKLYELMMSEYDPSNDDISGSIKHLWFDLGIERCHEFMDYKQLNECQVLIEELHESIQDKGTDDKSQTAKLLQVYAVKIQLIMHLIEDLARNDEIDMDRFNELQFKLRELINITQSIMTDVDIVDNKAMSIIYECWAKVYAANNDWINSYKYFKDAFLLYQQIAHKNTTKCLKYLLIAYMILASLPNGDDEERADKIPNPFAMDEIKVYQNHSEIVLMNNLVNTFENDNISYFNKLLAQQFDRDAFITKYLAFVQLRLQGKALCNLVKSYDRVKLEWLCKKLGMKMDGVERLIVKLIIDGELHGRLDQVNMILVLRERDVNKAGAVLSALGNWLKTVDNLRNTLNSRCANKASQTGFGGRGGFGAFGMGMDMDYLPDHGDDLYITDQAFLSWD